MSEAKEAKIVETWGYHATKEPQIFNIPEGGELPEGWHDHPDKAKESDGRTRRGREEKAEEKAEEKPAEDAKSAAE